MLPNRCANLAAGCVAAALCMLSGAAPARVDSAVIAQMEQSVVRVVERRDDGGATGTGFVLNADGYVATNEHVVDGGGRLFVVANRSKELLAATIAWKSAGLDLAILKVDDLERSPVEISGIGVSKGDPVYALGFPGLADKNEEAIDATVTDGIAGRLLNMVWREGGPTLSVIQHNAAINPGNSGGPLFDGCGRVVGVNTRGLSVMAGQGILFSSHISELLRELDNQSISYVMDNTPCEPVGEQLRKWIAVLAALLVLTFLLALRKPRKIIIREVKNYSQVLSRRLPRARAGGSRAADKDQKSDSPRLLLAGFSATGHPLRIVVGSNALRSAPTGLSVGRADELVDISLHDEQISRRHVRFSAVAERIFVEDLNSANGTRLNGKLLKPFQPSAIRPGDTLCLGSIEFSIST